MYFDPGYSYSRVQNSEITNQKNLKNGSTTSSKSNPPKAEYDFNHQTFSIFIIRRSQTRENGEKTGIRRKYSFEIFHFDTIEKSRPTGQVGMKYLW